MFRRICYVINNTRLGVTDQEPQIPISNSQIYFTITIISKIYNNIIYVLTIVYYSICCYMIPIGIGSFLGDSDSDSACYRVLVVVKTPNCPWPFSSSSVSLLFSALLFVSSRLFSSHAQYDTSLSGSHEDSTARAQNA